MRARHGDAPGPGDRVPGDPALTELAPANAGRPAGTIESAGGRPPADFTAEVSAAVRYESGLALKAVAVLAVLAVFLLLRALYL
jgi:hypothetical protein